MSKKYVFTTGLPRAGTTLFSAICKQNPRFDCAISGPLARFVRAIITESSTQAGYRHECPADKRKKLINGLFENYYDDDSKEVVFTHNRGWPLLLPTIKDLFPEAKILMFVRSIGQVLNSFEHLVRKSPYAFSQMFPQDENTSVYSRCEHLLNPNSSLGFAYTSVKQGITSEHKSDIMIIEYDYLAQNPEVMLKAIYTFIGEDYFQHDFDDVEYSNETFDQDVGLNNLHTVRRKVEFRPQEMIIPPDILQRVEGMEVWR